MFFVSITKKKIIDSLQSTNATELKYDNLVCTVVTDSFLSKIDLMQDGFSVVESPLLSHTESCKMVFSEVTYRHSEKLLEIFRSTISGRPIYYTLNTTGDFFCSTHISMLRRAGVRIEENTKVLPELFVYDFVIPPQTLYKNIHQIPSGSRLIIDLTDSNVRVRQSDEFRPPVTRNSNVYGSTETIFTETLGFLSEICRGLTPLNDKITVLLSGGLDSSILTRICQNLYDIEPTCSTGFPFENPDENFEKEYALSAAQAFGVRHEYYETSTKDYLFGFLEAISAAEVPLHHLQSVLLYLLFRSHALSKKTIVLSGEAADSIFGNDSHNQCFGMGDVKGVKLLSRYPTINLIKFLTRITGRGRGVLHRIYRSPASRVPLDDVGHVLWTLGRYGDVEWVKEYFGVSAKDIVANRYRAIEPYQNRSLLDMISILSYLGGGSATQAIWSKLGEANGKILFYPYSHFDLMEHTFSVPWRIKLEQPKNILREVGRYLSIPEYILTRPKKGFAIHHKKWAGENSVFEPLVPLAAKAFDEKDIRSMQSIQSHKKAMTFWNILNYAIWKRLCIDNEPLEALKDELSESLAENATRNKPIYKRSNYSPDARKQLNSWKTTQ